MIKNILSFLLTLMTLQVSGQVLSPQAQALYTEVFNTDTFHGNFAINHGATIHSSPDSSVFYLQWFPNGSTQPDTLPMLVTLHGSGGDVFDEFFIWYPHLMAHHCGIIAVQWYRGGGALPPNDYSLDTIIYNTIELALSSFSYPSGKVLLHGFSRGSARSYAMNLYDVLSGNNYFCTTISNAGSAELAYPLYADIDNNVYGLTPFSGKNWALYCGALDTMMTSGCSAMSNTQNWLTSKGANVQVFIQDPSGSHGGFHMNPSNADSIMIYYLQCFNGTLGTATLDRPMVNVYPNPTEGDVFIHIPSSQFKEGMWMEFYNSIGQLVRRLPLKESLIHVGGFTPGNYTWVVFHNGEMFAKGKLVVNQ